MAQIFLMFMCDVLIQISEELVIQVLVLKGVTLIIAMNIEYSKGWKTLLFYSRYSSECIKISCGWNKGLVQSK